MNKESIEFKLNMFLAAILVLITFIIFYSYSILYSKNTYYPTVNNGRLLTDSIRIKLEHELTNNKNLLPQKSDFQYTVVDLSGKVLLSSISGYKKGSIVNIKEFLEYDTKSSIAHPGFIKYTEPLVVNNNQVASVIFLIPKNNFLAQSPVNSTALCTLPIEFPLIIITLLSFAVFIFAKKNILIPIKCLNESASSILKGDFSHKINYDYDSEIGVLCHNFEAMRDELKYSKEKELSIRSDNKELLACISHDLKTPLTAINGYVQGIKDGIVKDPAGIQNYCAIILRRVKMLSKLLEDILEHSKAELNKLNIKLTEFYSGEFFRNILEDLSIEIKSAGLKFNAPDKIPNLIINADKKRISEVIYNLTSNSIKYSKKEGTISIYFKKNKNYLKIYIEDTGIGINSGDIPYIFKKFYRGEKCRNQNIEGSGLGLSISKYIVEAHGGSINCVKSSSQGTTMYFSLPI
ncbi:MAG: HAMP domain-containing sensor histidine kinase [Clostridium sp.]|nr:HAMP domain-containing sensor histidine kinase [Clostridium sp.]